MCLLRCHLGSLSTSGVRVGEGVVVVMVALFSEDVQFSGLNILFCLSLSASQSVFFFFAFIAEKFVT